MWDWNLEKLKKQSVTDIHLFVFCVAASPVANIMHLNQFLPGCLVLNNHTIQHASMSSCVIIHGIMWSLNTHELSFVAVHYNSWSIIGDVLNTKLLSVYNKDQTDVSRRHPWEINLYLSIDEQLWSSSPLIKGHIFQPEKLQLFTVNSTRVSENLTHATRFRLMLECKSSLWCRSMEEKENRAINTAFETLGMSASEQWPQMWAEVTARLNFTPCFQIYIAEQMEVDTSVCGDKSRNLKNSWFLLLKVWNV